MKQVKFTACISFAMLLIGCASIDVQEAANPNTTKTVWPNGAKAAIALTYDDAVDSHLDVALPALDAAGLKGTFYVTLDRYPWNHRTKEWVAAADNGHELGNHTFNHPCKASLPGREWVDPKKDLDKYTIAQMIAEIESVNETLSKLDGKQVRSFGYPCSESVTSDGSYYNAIKPLFVAARGVYDVPYVEGDIYNIPAYGPEGATGEQLIAYVKSVVAKGGAGSLLFHGVGADHLKVSAEAHQELLDYLVAHQDEIWVDTVVNIGLYVSGQ